MQLGLDHVGLDKIIRLVKIFCYMRLILELVFILKGRQILDKTAAWCIGTSFEIMFILFLYRTVTSFSPLILYNLEIQNTWTIFMRIYLSLLKVLLQWQH